MANEIRTTNRETGAFGAVVPSGFVILSSFVMRTSSFRGAGFFEFLDDFEDSVAAHDRIVHDELEGRGVFQNDGAGDQALDAFAMLGEQGEPALLLIGIAQNTEEHNRGVEVARHIHIVDRDQAGFTDLKFAADDFANGALQQLAHALHSERGHLSSEFLGDLFDGIALDVIADLKIAEGLDADPAFHAGADFVDFILEPAQGLGDALVNDFLAPAKADLAFDNAAAGHHAAGDGRAFGQLKNLADLGHADGDVFEDRFEQTGHTFFDLIDQLVNDRVELDLDAFVFGFVGHAAVHAGVKAEDDRGRSRGKGHVGFGDGADGAVDDFEGDFVGLDFFESFDNRFDRALGIGFDDDFEGLGAGGGEMGEKVFEGDFGAGGLLAQGFSLQRPLLGKVARGFFVDDDAEFEAGFGHAVKPQNFDGDRGAGFLKAFAFLADQGAHAAVVLAADHDVADAQGAFANQHGGGGAAGFEAGFDDVAFGVAVGIGLKFQQVGLEQNHLDEFVHPLFRQRGDIGVHRIAAPVIGDQAFVLQLLADP